MDKFQQKNSFHIDSSLKLTEEYVLYGGHLNYQGVYEFMLMKFSKDFKRIVTILEDDFSIRIWNLELKECTCAIFGNSQPLYATFSPCGSYLISSYNDNSLKIFDSYSGECLQSMMDDINRISLIEFSLNSKYFITLSRLQNSFRVRDFSFNSTSYTTFNHNDIVKAATFSPDSSQLISGGDDKIVQIWDLNTKEVIQTLKGFKFNLTNLAYSPNGKYIAVGDEDSQVYIYVVQSYQQIFSYKIHKNLLRKLQFSTDSEQIITICMDQIAKIWNVGSQKCINTFKGLKNGYIELTQNLQTVIQVDSDKNFQLKDLITKASKKMIQPQISFIDETNSMAISETTGLFVTACSDKTIKFWKLLDGSLINTIRSSHYQLEFFNDGIHLLTTNFEEIKIWQSITYQCKFTLKLSPDSIESYALSTSNTHLLIGTLKPEIGLWDINMQSQKNKKKNFFNRVFNKLGGSTQKPIWNQQCQKSGIIKLQFFSNDKYFVSCSNSSLYFRETKNGRLVKSLINTSYNQNSHKYFNFTILKCGKIMIVTNFEEIQVQNLKIMRQISRRLLQCDLIKQINNSNLLFCNDALTMKTRILKLQSPSFHLSESEAKEFQFFTDFCENNDYVVGVNQNYIKVFKKSISEQVNKFK